MRCVLTAVSKGVRTDSQRCWKERGHNYMQASKLQLVLSVMFTVVRQILFLSSNSRSSSSLSRSLSLAFRLFSVLFSSSLLLNNYILVESLSVAACCWLKWKQAVRRQDDGSQCQRQSYHHLAWFIFLQCFFSLNFAKTHLHRQIYTHMHKVFSDEQAAWGGVRRVTEWPSFW